MRYSNFVSESNVWSSSPWAMIAKSIGEFDKLDKRLGIRIRPRDNKMARPKFGLG